MSRIYYSYMMTNKRKNVLYTGVTSDLSFRVYEHKNKLKKGFTSKYNIKILVWYEEYDSIYDAIAREKQIKKWVRVKKEELINKLNPTWEDLSEKWYDD
ncbi:MAG: endonuclease [Candidatus Kerfeldbacteria bacterium RIFCSPLOWO2_01_FULL_48_11]|uniref:Endonuclease n=1 Tax=Candidatus Kerfeldbacteria bacterium RIFCSPLOWO2_01_FULL_48_11 TaxID=1798543 RepID=A0A1G2B2E6_9BACT|nr:MAG: endonuclease [Candidatus Kerfeldbacteria bacterium RIFCSPLOWO2_01_FULL_48_11]HCJ52126.1 endonuclease [Candidatus Kerfeldbacteria bacterium]HCM68750.1 endonuclease [Candidatus Kerfeldbacteria bacterium]